jgi:Replication-relaxation
MASPSPKKNRSKRKHSNHDRRKLFHATNARLGVVEVLANVDCATYHQIICNYFDTDEPTESQRRQIRQILQDLITYGYIRKLGEGFLEKPVYGLTAIGVDLAKANSIGDPKELDPVHKNFLHEIARTKRHFQIEQHFRDKGWVLRWKKTDLWRAGVQPDDLFSKTTGTKTTYFFYEREEEKKTFKELYDKARGFYDLFHTERCLTQWNFDDFQVIFDFRGEERMHNMIEHIKGVCQCQYYRGKIRHTCLQDKKKLIIPNFLFTCDAKADADIGGKIFVNPIGQTFSFSDF